MYQHDHDCHKQDDNDVCVRTMDLEYNNKLITIFIKSILKSLVVSVI